MSQQKPTNDKPDLDDYLDDQMDVENRSAFETSLQSNDELKQSVQLQQQIDESMRSQFKPPAFDREQLARSLAETESAPSQSSAKFKTVLKVTAAAAVIAISGWLIVANWKTLTGDKTRPYFSHPMTEIYDANVKLGFHPKWLCEDDREFAMTFSERQGQPLLLKEMPEGMMMVGLAYLGGLSEQSTTLMCRVNDVPVMVFVDKRDNDTNDHRVQPNESVHIYKTVRNGLVFYEVSPLDEPIVTEFLYAVDQIPPLNIP